MIPSVVRLGLALALLGACPWCLALPAPVAAQAARPSPPSTSHTALWSMPVAFEANRGQADPSVRFLVHGRGYTLLFTAAGP